MDDFPYKKLFMDPDEVKKKILNIKNNIPIFSSNSYKPLAIHQKLNLITGKYYDKYIKIITPDDLYEKVNILTDYFNEKSRMKCSFNLNLEPIKYFTLYKKKIYHDLGQNNINPQNIREYIYLHSKECNLFKVSTAAFVYDFFKAKHILDFSAGWGDRLLAACALQIPYFGIDPNLDNHKGYQDIINLAGTGGDTQEIFQSGAEYLPKNIIHERTQKYGKFDLIFTSPPYFDYEIYSSNLQSISSYAVSAAYWLVYFLFVVLIRYIPFLEIGGTLGLYIQDIKNKFIVCEPIVLFILSFYPNMEFSGIISEKFPILLFKKKENIVSIDKKSEENFMKTYPQIYQLSHRLIKRDLYNCYDIETKYFKYASYNVIDDNVDNNIYFRSFFKLLIQDDMHDKIITYGSKISNLVYYLAKITYMLNKTCEFYCPKIENDYSRTDANMNFLSLDFSLKILAAKNNFGLKIIEVDVAPTKKQLAFIASSIILDSKSIMISFNNYDNRLRNIMIETILETMTILKIDTNFTATIFLTVSMPLLIECLYEIFKYAKFFVVQTNKKNYLKTYEMIRTTLVYSDYYFSQNIEKKNIPVEINCIPHSSCKIWDIFQDNAVEGDILWLDAI
jgi:hypothetical protein